MSSNHLIFLMIFMAFGFVVLGLRQDRLGKQLTALFYYMREMREPEEELRREREKARIQARKDAWFVVIFSAAWMALIFGWYFFTRGD